LSKGASKQKDALNADDRRAVSTAVTSRMRELGLTVVEINRRTGLSETTIHGVIQGNSKPTKSTLALLSVVLDWQIGHLYNILRGRPHENVTPDSPLERSLAQLASGLAGIDTLREDVSELKDIVHRIDGKIDVVIAVQHPSSRDHPEPE
jgi:predicted transcriptional regulator